MAKKILLVNTTLNDGGAASVAGDLFHGLNKNDFQIFFAYGRGDKSTEARTFKFGNSFETLIHLALVRFLGVEGFGTYFSTKKMIKYIQQEKFDLIHIHNIHGYYLNFYYFFKFLKKSKIPVIWTLHDEWALTSLSAHSVEGYSYPKTYNKLFLRFALTRKQKTFGDLAMLTVISPAEWLYDKLKLSYLSGHNIRLIHNGVDNNMFKPASDKYELRKKYNLPADKKIILFSAASLNNKNKGIDSILKTADLLKDDQCVFVGVGDSNLKETSNLRLFGYIKDKKLMAELLVLSDVFCITSEAETQPLSVLESLSSGLPVVGFEILALREIINGDTGTLVSFGDVNNLAKIILENSEEGIRTEKSKKARNYALANFSHNAFLENYMNLYKELLK